jgi:hypothetical protein
MSRILGETSDVLVAIFDDNPFTIMSPTVIALVVYALGAVISFAMALLIKVIYVVVRAGKTDSLT